MTTHHDRLGAIERLQNSAIFLIRENAKDITMLSGYVAEQGRGIKDMRSDISRIEDRLNQMYDEINAHTLLLHQILERLPAKEKTHD